MGELGKRIRERRIELSLTVTEAAKQAQISRGYLHAIEATDRDAAVSEQVLFRLSRALDTTPALLRGKDADEAPLPLPPEVLQAIGVPSALPNLLPTVALATLEQGGRRLTRNDFVVLAQVLLRHFYGMPEDRSLRHAERLLAEATADEAIATDDRERGSRIMRRMAVLLRHPLVPEDRTTDLEPDGAEGRDADDDDTGVSSADG